MALLHPPLSWDGAAMLPLQPAPRMAMLPADHPLATERVVAAVLKRGARACGGRGRPHPHQLPVVRLGGCGDDSVRVGVDVAADALQAAAEGFTRPAVTALIDRLAGAGYVARVAVPGDRRATAAELQPATWRVFA